MKKQYEFLIYGTGSIIAGASAGCSLPQQQTTRLKPNIIYIYADDLGYGELGCYGQSKIRTPNLDRLAAEGIRFTQHYTSCPVSAAARCMLLTGRHSGHSYIRNNYELGGFTDEAERGQMPLPENTETIGRMLQRAGYITGVIGKWGLGGPNSTGIPARQGFDFFYGYLDQKQAHNYYPTHLWKNDIRDPLDNEWFRVHQKFEKEPDNPAEYDLFTGKEYALDAMVEESLKFISTYRDKAFFLYLPFTVPHLSLQVPKESLAEYDGMFEEKAYLGENGYCPNPQPLSTYAAMITRMDSKVGVIMEKLKELGLDKQTIVMFSSDNGTTFNGGVDADFFYSTAGLRGLKTDLYEGGIRVPFIVHWPGKIKAGSVSEHISAQYDIYPTLKEIVEENSVYATDGISLLPTLLGNESEQQKHEYLYWEFSAKRGQLAIRIGNMKGVKQKVADYPDGAWEIYNLQNDREETTNIAVHNLEMQEKLNLIVAQRMPAHLKDWNFMDYNAQKDW
ncbi:MAG: arylsulfatase [Tannerella sp.]|jgi:arylsulfatase A-like enzyme|nr:arylsulfatase [Tannerella sp.]